MSISDDSVPAVRRSEAYGFLAALFEYPEGELGELVRDGTVATRAESLIDALYPELRPAVDLTGLRQAGEGDDLAVEYTRLFDVVQGAGGPRCPLNSTDYEPDVRMRQLEELVRFYNYFGLTSAEAPAHERPDHVTAQLDFLHYLCFEEEQCGDAADAAGNYRRAQRDFIARHPARWAPLLVDRLAKNDAHPFYRAVGELAGHFIRREAAETAAFD